MSKKKINLPTYLTIARIILVIPFIIFAGMLDGQIFKILALIIFVAAALTDKFDGYLARKNNQVTDLGAFLDPLADKMLVNSAFLCLVVQSIVPIWVFAIILWRDFAVDGIRFIAAKKGETISASIWGKSKTMVQMIAIIILIFAGIVELDYIMLLGNITLYVALALTLISGYQYIYKGWKKYLA